MPTKGLIIINTGDGKGKTTAALGQAIRAAGQGFKVCIIQFIKGKWTTGEMKSLELFKDKIELHTTGTGFTWEADNIDDRYAENNDTKTIGHARCPGKGPGAEIGDKRARPQ